MFRTLKCATPHLERSHGHVLVVASALSFVPLAALASYGASKAGVEMLALAYRQEVAHLGLTVGVVHPSWIAPISSETRTWTLPCSRARAGASRIPATSPPARAVAVANWAEGPLNSTVAWPWMRRFAAWAVPNLEREVEALGRLDQVVPSADPTERAVAP